MKDINSAPGSTSFSAFWNELCAYTRQGMAALRAMPWPSAGMLACLASDTILPGHHAVCPRLLLKCRTRRAAQTKKYRAPQSRIKYVSQYSKSA